MASAPNPRQLAAEQRAEAARNYRIVLEVDGEEHVFRLGDLTALDVAALRREAGMTIREMVSGADRQDADAVATLMWLARRQAGERRLRWEQVAEGVTVGQTVVMRHEDDQEQPEGEDGYPDPPG